MQTLVSIYWIFDTRPELVAAGWHSGVPFYCGKTIKHPDVRLAQHLASAYRAPRQPTSKRIRECGRHIRIEVVYVVKPHENWGLVEKSWITCLRMNFSGTTNIASGGFGRERKKITAEMRDLRKRIEARRLKKLRQIEAHLQQKREFYRSRGRTWPPDDGIGEIVRRKMREYDKKSLLRHHANVC